MKNQASKEHRYLQHFIYLQGHKRRKKIDLEEEEERHWKKT
jgi:hypothetical protein